MKYMYSKYYGKCSTCERAVTPGERIAWHSKGVIECDSCMPAEPAAQTAPQPTQSTNAVTGDNWADALAWDQTTPKPGASITNNVTARNKTVTATIIRPKPQPDGRERCDQCDTLDELSYNDHTGTALCGDCDDAANNAAKYSGNVTRIDTRKPEPLEQLDAQTQTVADLLVTLVNAVSRLDTAQRMELGERITGFANGSATEERRAIWRGLSNIA